MSIKTTTSSSVSSSSTAEYVNLLLDKPYGTSQSPAPHNGNQSPGAHSVAHQAPEIVSRSQDCTVPSGATAILSCHIRNHEHAKITWRKAEPNPAPIGQSAKFSYTVTAAGEARLVIAQTSLQDSGLYVCAVANRYGMTQCTVGVSVLASQLDVLSERSVEVVGPTSVRIGWESLNVYLIEACEVGASSWMRLDDQPVRSKQILTGLAPGESYTFQLVCPTSRATSVASAAVTMPMSETHMWQQQQFTNRYTTLSELGRGRYSALRLASDLVTGQHVVLKQISRRHQDLGTTKEEYKLLASAQHPNIVRGLALFENAPTPGADTIVMEL